MVLPGHGFLILHVLPSCEFISKKLTSPFFTEDETKNPPFARSLKYAGLFLSHAGNTLITGSPPGVADILCISPSCSPALKMPYPPNSVQSVVTKPRRFVLLPTLLLISLLRLFNTILNSLRPSAAASSRNLLRLEP